MTNHNQYGHLPPKNVQHLNPWDDVHVEMIGHWKIIINKIEYQIRAVTYIDAVINLHDVISVDNAKSKTVAEPFKDNWISRYPTARRCNHG